MAASVYTLIGRLWWRMPGCVRNTVHRYRLSTWLKRALSLGSSYVDSAGKYGLVNGIRLWQRIQHVNKEEAFPVPCSQHKVLVRQHTEDADVFRSVFLREECHVPLLGNHVPRLIIDGGAYVGYSTVYYALAYPNARVIAVEPEPGNFNQLRLNTTGLANVTIIHGALWHQNEPLNIENPDAPSYSYRVEPVMAENATCPAYTIRDIMRMVDATVIDILKLDVEGAEYNLLRHSTDWIGQVNLICAEMHDRFQPGCTEAFRAVIDRMPLRLIVKNGEKLIARREHWIAAQSCPQ